MKLKMTKGLLKQPLAFDIMRGYGRRHYSRLNKDAQGIWLDFTCRKIKAAWRHDGLVVWGNVFSPFELFYGLGVTVCQPETMAALAARIGIGGEAINCAETCGYSSDMCSFYRCGAGLAEDRLIPGPDLIVSTSYLCDGGVKFYYNMSKHYGCEYYLLDIPYHNTEKARVYLARQLEELAFLIAEKQGRAMDLGRLREALRLSNEAREYNLMINELRRAAPCPLSGSDALSFVLDMQFFGFGSEAGVKFFKHLYAEVKDRADRGKGAVDEEKARLLWLHQIRPYYPNKIISHLEAMGASVCFGEANHIYWEPLDENNPFESLAAKMLANPGGGPLDNRSRLARELAGRYDVNGVIHFSHWGCRQSSGGEYIIRDKMREDDIPVLILSGDGADSRNYSEEQTKLRLDAFLEMLESKR